MPMLRWFGLRLTTSLAVDADRAGGRGLEAGDHAQRRGLAAAGGAEEGDELALLDVEVEVADHVGGAVVTSRRSEISRKAMGYRRTWVCFWKRVTSWIRPMQAQVMAKAITASAAGS